MSKPITIPTHRHTPKRYAKSYNTVTVLNTGGYIVNNTVDPLVQDIRIGLENPLFVDERLSARTGNWRITPDGDWEELHKEMDNSIDRLFSVLKKSKPSLLTRIKRIGRKK